MEPGTIVSHYELLAQIGAGGMGGRLLFQAIKDSPMRCRCNRTLAPWVKEANTNSRSLRSIPTAAATPASLAAILRSTWTTGTDDFCRRDLLPSGRRWREAPDEGREAECLAMRSLTRRFAPPSPGGRGTSHEKWLPDSEFHNASPWTFLGVSVLLHLRWRTP